MINLNQRQPELLTNNVPQDNDLRDIISFKNFKYKKAKDYLNPFCLSIIEQMMGLILKREKYHYIDIKYHTTNTTSSNGLWHLDSSLNPTDYYYENYLFVTGEHNLTEFINKPLQLDNSCFLNKKSFSKTIEQLDLPITRIKPNTITRFYGDNVHRGPKILKSENRLLIRLINTNRKTMPNYFL